MPIAIAAVTVLLQAFFIIHVFRTGRSAWWAFFILSMPIIGCIVYYFVEVFPDSKEHRSFRNSVQNMRGPAFTEDDLRAALPQVIANGSVDEKIALAQDCLTLNMPGEAVTLYESCMSGPYAHDANLLFALAGAHAANGTARQGLVLADRLAQEHPKYKPAPVKLLRARLLEGVDDVQAALDTYETLLPAYTGLEARYRYAVLLQRLGQHELAIAQFQHIVQQSRRAGSAVPSEQEWAQRAQRELAQ